MRELEPMSIPSRNVCRVHIRRSAAYKRYTRSIAAPFRESPEPRLIAREVQVRDGDSEQLEIEVNSTPRNPEPGSRYQGYGVLAVWKGSSRGPAAGSVHNDAVKASGGSYIVVGD